MDNSIKEPTVTVLMPVYNGELYLREAIESILSQTFSDFEFLIIDDGSTDQSVSIINSYSDKRIRLVSNEENCGLVETLNKGIQLAKGEYIARMDADDISFRKRLEKQVEFMELHPILAVCGTWYKKNIRGKIKIIQHLPLSNEEIRCVLFFNSPIAHPSVMIRKSVINEHNMSYSSSFKHAEDYELWIKIIEIAQIANLPDALIYYRQHSEQVSSYNSIEKRESTSKIRLTNLRKINIYATEDELDLHNMISEGRIKKDKNYVNGAEQWLIKIKNRNHLARLFNNNEFGKVLLQRWALVCGNCGLGWYGYRKFFKSSLYKKQRLDFHNHLILFTKCMIKWHVS